LKTEEKGNRILQKEGFKKKGVIAAKGVEIQGI
jgi:hypothetical protein